MGAKNRLRTTLYVDGSDFMVHLADLRTKWQEAVERGTLISDATFRTIIMNSLPESWNTIVASLYTTTTSTTLIVGLSVHWERLKMQKQAVGTTATALQADAKLSRPKVVCLNLNCKRTGHTMENCYWRGGRKEGQFLQTFRNRKSALAALEAVKKSANPKTDTTTPQAKLADTSTPISHVSYALMAHPKAPSLYAIKANGLVPTYADSGVSDHCFVDRNVFSDYEELSTPREGQSAPVSGIFQIIGQGTMGTTHARLGGELSLSWEVRRGGLLSDLYQGQGHLPRHVWERGTDWLTGEGHQSLMVVRDTDDNVLLSDSVPPPNPAVPGVLPTRQPIAPCIHPTDVPLHEPSGNNPDPSSTPVPDTDLVMALVPVVADQPHPCQSEQLAAKQSTETRDIPPRSYLAEDAFAFLATLNESDMADDDEYIPEHYGKAMRRADLWVPAMEQELKILADRKVFELVPRKEVPEGKKIIGCRWVYANKYDAEGNVVAGEDFDETYAAVVCLESLRILAAIAVQLNLHIWQVDFVSAYLNSVPEHTVYMQVPPGFQGGEDKVCRLLKTIYGMMQGGRDWWRTLDKAYKNLGYKTSHADSCVWTRMINGEHTITNTFTNDTFGLSTTAQGMADAKQELGNTYEIKDLRDPSFIVGMAIKCDHQTGSISLSQQSYLKRVLEHFGLQDCNAHHTPLPTGI
ncbi:hypothetical protein E4T56_gene8533 [Termitomyces sp. T112]|nr:hypothetical protein E4T56_gene8533 [Termitomyces sp. T112]